MGIHVPIEKVSEDAHGATYRFTKDVFEPDPARPRRLRVARTLVAVCSVAKGSGAVVLVDDGGWAAGSGEFARVQQRLKQHWQAGEFPAVTSWSS